MIGQILGSLGGLAKSYIDGKTAVKITEAEIKKKQLTGEIDWEQSAIEASKDSWKDELWAIVFVLILAANFVPSLQAHDQNEAMTFAENVIVMDAGRIVQVGTPKELFERPKTTFVGYFIGAPAMNFFRCERGGDYSLRFGGNTITTQTCLTELSASQFKLGIRSEYIKIVDTAGQNTISARVQRVEDLGNHKLVSVVSNDLDIKVKVHRDTAIPADHVHLDLPAENCCVYADEFLVEN